MMVRTKKLFMVVVICASFSTAYGMKKKMEEEYKPISDEKNTDKSLVVEKQEQGGIGDRKISFEDLLLLHNKVPLHCVMRMKKKKEKGKIGCGCFLFLKRR